MNERMCLGYYGRTEEKDGEELRGWRRDVKEEVFLEKVTPGAS